MAVRWGVIGVGRAGAARARAILADPESVGAGGIRGRPEEVGLPRAEGVPALLASCDAVAICSPDHTHPALARRALEAGCHVVCEFPLAATAAEAAALLALARDRGRVLHVEHIELLSGAARWWRAQDLSRPVTGRLSFTSARADASPALGNLARLHRIVDILGLPSAVEVAERTAHGLSGQLRFADGSAVALDFRFAPGLPRRTALALAEPGGRERVQVNGAVWVDGQAQETPRVGGLFAADHAAAMGRILCGAPPYVSDARLLDVLGLVEQLEALTPTAGGAAAGS